MSKVDASSEAVRARIGVLETDYAADGAGFDAKLLAALLTRAESAEAERDEARRDATRLSAAVYVPGRWQCKKCGFGLMQMMLRASDGAIGVRDDPGEYCPNDGSPLWRVTEREAGNELVDRAQEYLKRAVDAESDLAAARETIAAKDAEIAKLREAAKSGLRFVGASDDALLEANATIARLTRERDESVKAEREACAKVYDEFFDWVSKQISRATYLAEAHKKGKAAWATLANSMFDGTLASYRDAIRARARANAKEPTT